MNQNIFRCIAAVILSAMACSCKSTTTTRSDPADGLNHYPLIKNIHYSNNYCRSFGAIIRGDTLQKKIALVFTGDEFGDGEEFIANTLKEKEINASFFLTGNFYRNKEFTRGLNDLKKRGNYLGSHSDKHLLYCDWIKRDSLFVTQEGFVDDLNASYHELSQFNVNAPEAHYFLPPYEWYNDSIADWTSKAGLQLVNFTPGTRSTADYTYPEMGNRYVDSKTIYNSILSFESSSTNGLNGFILLVHIGTDPRRTDKFYNYLPDLIDELEKSGYEFVRIDELLSPSE